MKKIFIFLTCVGLVASTAAIADTFTPIAALPAGANLQTYVNAMNAWAGILNQDVDQNAQQLAADQGLLNNLGTSVNAELPKYIGANYLTENSLSTANVTNQILNGFAGANSNINTGIDSVLNYKTNGDVTSLSQIATNYQNLLAPQLINNIDSNLSTDLQNMQTSITANHVALTNSDNKNTLITNVESQVSNGKCTGSGAFCTLYNNNQNNNNALGDKTGVSFKNKINAQLQNNTATASDLTTAYNHFVPTSKTTNPIVTNYLDANLKNAGGTSVALQNIFSLDQFFNQLLAYNSALTTAGNLESMLTTTVANNTAAANALAQKPQAGQNPMVDLFDQAINALPGGVSGVINVLVTQFQSAKTDNQNNTSIISNLDKTISNYLTSSAGEENFLDAQGLYCGVALSAPGNAASNLANAISDCENHQNRPQVLKLGPGVFDLGNNTIEIPANTSSPTAPGLAIVGSGDGLNGTVIQSEGPSQKQINNKAPFSVMLLDGNNTVNDMNVVITQNAAASNIPVTFFQLQNASTFNMNRVNLNSNVNIDAAFNYQTTLTNFTLNLDQFFVGGNVTGFFPVCNSTTTGTCYDRQFAGHSFIINSTILTQHFYNTAQSYPNFGNMTGIYNTVVPDDLSFYSGNGGPTLCNAEMVAHETYNENNHIVSGYYCDGN